MDAKAYRSAARQGKASAANFGALAEVIGKWQENDSFSLIERVADVVRRFDPPLSLVEEEDDAVVSWELLRAFDRHGEGVRPFDPGAFWEPGDVWISSKRSLRIVERVDDRKRAAGFIGAPPKKDEVPVLSWRPSADPRKWLGSGQQTASAYAEPVTALNSLAGLWGKSESETRYLRRAEAMFWQLVETPGVKIHLAGLEREANLAQVQKWLLTQGLSALGGNPLHPGDLVLDPMFDGIGIVLAATPAGLCDVVHILRGKSGLCGEKKGEATIARGCEVPGSAMRWRPAARG